MRAMCLCAAAVLLAWSAAGQAKPPLSAVESINVGLRDVKIADEIRIHCDTIAARMIVAWARLDGLKREAKTLGYSDDEIDDFVRSKSDRRRLEQDATDYMGARGVVPGDEATYCALGRDEIASGSQIGGLLRER